MFSAAIKSGAAGNPTDPKFNYVTMLLHGDGTNGAQNNTFLDSSTNNFTITRNGNTTQGTFSPYGSNWSNYLNGSSYLSSSASAGYAFGTGDFTVEGWFFVTASADQGLFDTRASTASTTGVGARLITSTNTLRVILNNVALFTTSTAVTLNTWNHIAIVRSSGTVTAYLNGTAMTGGSATGTTNITDTGIYVGKLIDTGYFFNGYISNFRVVKGTALYTGNFTPSTTPLTALSGTSLLTCQSNRFIDNSSSALTLTLTGSPSVQRFSPFSPTTAYSTSVIGGSGYFDGSGDYLGFPNNTAFDFSTGDFTVEAWVYRVGTGSGSQVYEAIIGGNTSGVSYWTLYVNSSNNTVVWYGNDSTLRSTSNTITNNTWNHVAVSRSSGTLKIFINGVQGYSASVSTSYSLGSGGGGIGLDSASTGNKYFYGYINDTRVVKGTALYTSAFTPPTAPLTAVSGTSLLTNFTNAGILDNAMMNDLETRGNAQISTSVKKYGTGSMVFDATDDRLVSASSPNIAFGTGDFTVEFWLNSNNVSSANQRGVIQTSDTAGGLKPAYTTGIAIYQGGNASGGALSGGLTANVGGTFLGSSSAVITTGTWYHIALVRSSGTSTIYVNGTSVGSATTTGNCSGQNICVGGYYDTTYLYSGYIDDLRITKGYARYTSNFTAPTAAFPNN